MKLYNFGLKKIKMEENYVYDEVKGFKWILIYGCIDKNERGKLVIGEIPVTFSDFVQYSSPFHFGLDSPKSTKLRIIKPCNYFFAEFSLKLSFEGQNK